MFLASDRLPLPCRTLAFAGIARYRVDAFRSTHLGSAVDSDLTARLTVLIRPNQIHRWALRATRASFQLQNQTWFL